MMFAFDVKTARDHVIAHTLQSHLWTQGAGRIHDALRSRTGVAYTGNSDIEIYSDCARFTIFAEVKKEKMPQMVGAVARSLQDLRFRGLSEAEHDAARLMLMRDLRAADDVPEIAAVEYAHSAVREMPDPEAMREILSTVTAQDVTAFARSVFRTKNALIVVGGPRDDDDQRTAWQLFESALGG
jgi:predicted Zn-dependent peptidase